MEKPKLVAEHFRKGYMVEIRHGQDLFVREEGPKDGEVVLMIHGVPSSSFLYAKFFPLLAEKGYRAMSFDLPGMGLSDKPLNGEQSYNWEGLKDALKLLVDKLKLNNLNLVIHDIGGPIGAWYAIENQERVKRIIILDTLMNLPRFWKPFPMWTFATYGLRRVAMATLNPFVFRQLMNFLAVVNSSEFTYEDAKAWVYLLKSNSGTETFLKIMDGFILTPELTQKLKENMQTGFEIAVIWGAKEKSIPKSQLEYIEREFPVKLSKRVNGAHFLQVDCYKEICDYIHEFITSA